MPAHTRAASGPIGGDFGGQGDPPLTAEEIKIREKRIRTVRETAICPKCIEGCFDSDRHAATGALSPEPSSTNPHTLSCHVRKKTTWSEKIVKSLLAVAASGNSKSPLAAAANTTPTFATCRATEFQYLSATVSALQSGARLSKVESNSKVAAVIEELQKVHEENGALKDAMNEDSAPRKDDEINQQLEKLSKELEEVRNENSALRSRPGSDLETPFIFCNRAGKALFRFLGSSNTDTS